MNLGDLKMGHGVVLAPLTRMRAGEPGQIPHLIGSDGKEMFQIHYAQRAQGGTLLIAEASQISREGQGYGHTPGCYSEEQTKHWKVVCDAVHKAGGLIVMQLWHVGRISHSSYHNGALPVSASPIKMRGRCATENDGPQPAEVPRPLGTDEVSRVVEDYRKACVQCKEAGFDGVEIHSANNYLLEQFLNNGTNIRTDKYGGSLENRSRFLFEVVEACCSVYGSGRVGVRLSPHENKPKDPANHPPKDEKGEAYSDIVDTDPLAIYDYAVKGLEKYNLAFLHLIEPRFDQNEAKSQKLSRQPVVFAKRYRSMYKGKIIAASGFTPATAEEAIDLNYADAIAFGRYFISNPDLPERMRKGLPLNKYDRPTFYYYTEHGYTNYPYDAEILQAYRDTEVREDGTKVLSTLRTSNGGEWLTFKNQKEGTAAGGSYQVNKQGGGIIEDAAKAANKVAGVGNSKL